jgi:hypothetical protein
VARHFCDMTSHVADSMQPGSGGSSGTGAAGDKAAAQQKAKQARWRAMALLCHGAGALDAAGEDAAAMIKLVVSCSPLHSDQT